MKTAQRCAIVFLIALTLGLIHRQVAAEPFLAYSLKEAERRLKESGQASAEVRELGGITRIAGMVFDPTTGDLILVGQVITRETKITIDLFVEALRARLVHQVWPLVSIDKTPETAKTGQQIVRYEGVSNSAFARDLWLADVALKKLALGLLRAEVWGLRSYFVLSVEGVREKGGEELVSSRFWFTVGGRPSLAVREGVFAIKELRVGVQTQVMQASIKGKAVADLSEFRDTIGDAFAEAVSANYADLSVYYSEIARLKALFDLVALAQGVRVMSPKPDLRYWLQEYRVPYVETPKEYPLLRQREEIRTRDTVRVVDIDGGIELKALVLRLQDGDVSALREAVLLTRPSGRALTWRVPLEGWHIPGAPDSEGAQGGPMAADAKPSAAASPRIGTSVTRSIHTLSTSPMDVMKSVIPVTPLPSAIAVPSFDLTKGLSSQRFANNVGGVMLHGAATISGTTEANVDLSKGHFALIVEGKSAQLDPRVFRKFITALWAVYFCGQSPGVSIDPIAPGVQKHLVRYIGCRQVINSDLARVMRVSDELMKKWTVGTEKPDIPGFKDVDDLMAKYGFRYLGARRRFWFVPEGMTFKRSDDMLLFERGRMTVKTEYVVQNKGAKAEPADEAFARFFIDHYPTIAAHPKYGVYQELFDYAKLSALVIHLKDQGIPLFWFLMANKDLVLTEDSPGTVDALAKGSKHFEGIRIEGGVKLQAEGRYVYDEQAVQAVREARAKLSATPSGPTRTSANASVAPPRSESFSFELEKEKKSYSVVPQHSLTSGKDRRGIRYQTDLALCHQGQPGLELVRYYQPSRPDGGEFGHGWHLLIPYRVKPVGTAKREFLNAIIPVQMAVENLLTGEQEVLTFSTDRYTIAGYVPNTLEASQVIGLFLMSDASSRLADKLGNEFGFDQGGYLTDMRFSTEHHVRVEYLKTFTNAFEQPPYRLEPADGERIPFLNVRIPKQMTVVDLLHGGREVLTFTDKGRIAGYVPVVEGKSQHTILALLSDGSYRLLDNAGNEAAFTPAGEFSGMAVSPERRMVAALFHGQQRVRFTYTLDASGQPRIASARLSSGKDGTIPAHVVQYQYDEAGRLTQVIGPVKRVAEFQHPAIPTNRQSAPQQSNQQR